MGTARQRTPERCWGRATRWTRPAPRRPSSFRPRPERVPSESRSLTSPRRFFAPAITGLRPGSAHPEVGALPGVLAGVRRPRGMLVGGRVRPQPRCSRSPPSRCTQPVGCPSGGCPGAVLGGYCWRSASARAGQRLSRGVLAAPSRGRGQLRWLCRLRARAAHLIQLHKKGVMSTGGGGDSEEVVGGGGLPGGRVAVAL